MLLVLAGLLGCSGLESDLEPGWRAYQAGNLAVAYQEWLKPAMKGNARAQTLIGELYWDRLDYDKAATWYVKAAQQGDLLAESRLAEMVENGLGVTQIEAQPWLKRK